MELYEIVKFTRKPIKGEEYFEPEVITATMDKNMAEQMLEIYKQHQKMHESYQIRTLSEPKTVLLNPPPSHCLACNDYHRCVNMIETKPHEMMRCFFFCELKRYIKEL